MRIGRLVTGILASAALGCAADFTPRSVLVDLRVLAIVATPLEAGPADEVTLTPITVPPPGATIAEQRWAFCPLSVGAAVGYACAVPGCEVTLDAAPDGSVTASPGALAEACLSRLAGAGGLPPGIPARLPDQVPTVFRYVVTASDGQVREAIQTVPLYPGGAPADRNLPPVITGVQIGGQDVAAGATAPPLSPGGELQVRVLLDPASAQTFRDAAGLTVRESMVVSYFTTAGRFDYDFASGPDARVQLKYEEIDATTTEALLWLVARDLRGGETPAGPFRVPIAH